MIPLAKDTRECVGSFAENVENRSLLFQKMVLSKSCLHDVDRFDDAQRFNVLRATHEGNEILREEKTSAQFKADSPRALEHVKAQARYRAAVAGALAGVRVDNPQLATSRIQSNNRFLLALEASYTGRSVIFSAALGGRLLINMAGGVMENSGMALDRISGLPYLPGSAVKGVTRHTALWEIRHEENSTRRRELLRAALVIFGYATNDIGPKGDFLWAVRGDREALAEAAQGLTQDAYKGVCAFVAAQPVSSAKLAIVAEVLTPHVNNNLRPIFFPAVEAGSEFGFAIIGQRVPEAADLSLEGLLTQAGLWLRRAITENGIGAKTGAGYGWFIMDPQAEERRRAELEAEALKAAAEAQETARRAMAEKAAREAALLEAERLASLSPLDLAAEQISKLPEQEFADYAKNIASKEPDEQRAFFRVLKDSELKETRKRWKKRKPELWEALMGIASSLGTPLE